MTCSRMREVVRTHAHSSAHTHTEREREREREREGERERERERDADNHTYEFATGDYGCDLLTDGSKIGVKGVKGPESIREQ